MKLLRIISDCPAEARKWYISDFVMRLHSKNPVQEVLLHGILLESAKTQRLRD